MNAAIWGTKMWDTLFTGALYLSPAESVDMFTILTHVLPCTHCRRSYAHYIERHPPLINYLLGVFKIMNSMLHLPGKYLDTKCTGYWVSMSTQSYCPRCALRHYATGGLGASLIPLTFSTAISTSCAARTESWLLEPRLGAPGRGSGATDCVYMHMYMHTTRARSAPLVAPARSRRAARPRAVRFHPEVPLSVGGHSED